eukprot:CAMPEP_0179427076 /NCGR_PEP_ID=MMETSP0799-20121207/13158_1 /TAXON_ID=46947 /ORGANISM="Geminigera cryophila, Strain CCMP2564" /LENGTH=55 /DNA_ID=CAMNT_0021202029 /DNA_START=395 /DNA_END=562 /DNA_ORIENTATION=-
MASRRLVLGDNPTYFDFLPPVVLGLADAGRSEARENEGREGDCADGRAVIATGPL